MTSPALNPDLAEAIEWLRLQRSSCVFDQHDNARFELLLETLDAPEPWRLNAEQSAAFVKAIAQPAEPNEALRLAALSAPVGETVLGPNDPWCGAINPEGYRDSPPAPHVPEGWRVVPVEATEAMNNAGYKEWNRLHAASVALIYRAMLSASPAAPLVGGDGWRDIASAPKDGTHIILAFGQDHSSEGWYEDDDNDPRPWRFIDMADFNEVIINSCRDGEYGPSHWQPMPYREPRNHPTPPPPEGTR